jgi:hypothetical protein
MTKSISILLVFIFILACQNKKSPQLIGRTIAYTYGSDVYHLTIDSDSTLHWEAKVGPEKGLKGNEQYTADWLNEHQFFISWYEANNVGVSQILDFKEGKVFNHLLSGRKAHKGFGQIKLLE